MADPTSYGEILARNIRAVRARRKLGQESLAARMRNLGFDGWVRQTVGSTERPTRRVTVEELFGLALALETSLPGLLTETVPEAERSAVLLAGQELSAESAAALVSGLNDGAVKWDGDVPVFGVGNRAWWGDPPGAGRTVAEVLSQGSDEAG